MTEQDTHLTWYDVEASDDVSTKVYSVKALDGEAACNYVQRICHWAKETKLIPTNFS